MTAAGARKWAPALGLTAVVVYVALTIVAVALYPGSTSPVDIYLSDLGNADYSPDGWAVFDLAMILGGLLSLPFFVGIYDRYREKAPRRWLRTGLVAGIVNGVAVLMAGAVAEHVNLAAHIVWSMLIFVSFLPLLTAHGWVLEARGVLKGGRRLRVCGVSGRFGTAGCALCHRPRPGPRLAHGVGGGVRLSGLGGTGVGGAVFADTDHALPVANRRFSRRAP